MVPWSVAFPDYSPPDYTDPRMKGQSYADPEQPGKDGFEPVWNKVDGPVNRASYVAKYAVVEGMFFCEDKPLRGRLRK